MRQSRYKPAQLYYTDHNKNIYHETTQIFPGVKIGKGNYFGPFCIIGAPPEKRGFTGDDKSVMIGDNNRFEGAVTIDAGIDNPTRINSNVMMMKGSHAGHDAILFDDVTVACGAKIGGHTIVMKGANIGLNACIHQRHIVGPYAMIGMNAAIPKSKEVLPFGKYVGAGRYIGTNEVAIERAELSEEEIEYFHQVYKAAADR